MNMTVLRSRERAFDHVHDVRTWTTSASARPHTASRSHWPRHADHSHRANSMGRSLPSLPSFLPSQHTVIRTDSHSVPGKPPCDHNQCSSNRKGSVSSDCTTRERPGKDPRAYEGRRMHWTWIESEGATKEAHFASGMAIQMFHDVLQTKEDSRNHFPRLSGTRLVCHCTPSQACHADSIMSECRLLFPTAYDPEAGNGIVLRLDPDTDDQSSPDEGAPARGSGKPSQVGSCYTARALCDGPRPHQAAGKLRIQSVLMTIRGTGTTIYKAFSHRVGTPTLLASLILGKVSVCPFDLEEICRRPMCAVVQSTAQKGSGWPFCLLFRAMSHGAAKSAQREVVATSSKRGLHWMTSISIWFCAPPKIFWGSVHKNERHLR